MRSFPKGCIWHWISPRNNKELLADPCRSSLSWLPLIQLLPLMDCKQNLSRFSWSSTSGSNMIKTLSLFSPPKYISKRICHLSWILLHKRGFFGWPLSTPYFPESCRSPCAHAFPQSNSTSSFGASDSGSPTESQISLNTSASKLLYVYARMHTCIKGAQNKQKKTKQSIQRTNLLISSNLTWPSWVWNTGRTGSCNSGFPSNAVFWHSQDFALLFFLKKAQTPSSSHFCSNSHKLHLVAVVFSIAVTSFCTLTCQAGKHHSLSKHHLLDNPHSPQHSFCTQGSPLSCMINTHPHSGGFNQVNNSLQGTRCRGFSFMGSCD